MAKEKNENVMINEETGEVMATAEAVEEIRKSLIDEIDPFASRRESDSGYDSSSEGDTVSYKVPLKVMRYESSGKGDRKYYNYAVGYKVKINGKEMSQVIDLEPTRRADVYDLLDAIFGEETMCPFEVVRTARTVTNNGVQKTRYIYGIRVCAKDEDGVELHCSLTPTRGNTDKFDNYIEKLKAAGYVS